jgi:hypothetical protein
MARRKIRLWYTTLYVRFIILLVCLFVCLFVCLCSCWWIYLLLFFIYPFSIFPRTNISIRCRPFGTCSACEAENSSIVVEKTEARGTARTLIASRMPTTSGSARCSMTSCGSCQENAVSNLSILKNAVSECQCRVVLSIQQPFPTAIPLRAIYSDWKCSPRTPRLTIDKRWQWLRTCILTMYYPP